MTENKTKPTKVRVKDFLSSVSELRQKEAGELIKIMRKITGKPPVMWGPSIIGFGSQHYKYDTGREGDMPELGFSPRKAAITVYFSEGFDRYTKHMEKLGRHKASVSCLYINKLSDVDTNVLSQMLTESYSSVDNQRQKPTTAQEYIDQVPTAARTKFDQLRNLVKQELPQAKEVLSYGIIGYKVDDKRARVYISGWKDHLSIYPVPKDKSLQQELKAHVKGKGTLWFDLENDLPRELIKKVVGKLAK